MTASATGRGAVSNPSQDAGMSPNNSRTRTRLTHSSAVRAIAETRPKEATSWRDRASVFAAGCGERDGGEMSGQRRAATSLMPYLIVFDAINSRNFVSLVGVSNTRASNTSPVGLQETCRMETRQKSRALNYGTSRAKVG